MKDKSLKNKPSQALHSILLVLAVCFLICIPTVSAFEFDNVKSYDPVTRIVTITNAFGLGDIIGEARLNTPLNVKVPAGYQKVGEFDLWAYQDYNDALKPISFKNMKNSEEEIRDYDYRYLSYEEVLVDDYTLECSDVFNVINNSYSQECENVLTGSHYETKQIWNKITPADLKKNDVLTIGVFTEVKEGDHMDWEPVIYGVEIPEWAEWTEDQNVNIVGYYKLDLTSSGVLESTGNIINGTNGGATRGVAGKINNSFDFEKLDSDRVDLNSGTGLGADLDFITGENFSICMWVKPESIPAVSYLVGKRLSEVDYQYVWRLDTSGYMQLLTSGGLATSSNNTLSVGTWQHICVTYEGGVSTKFYYNGDLEHSGGVAGITHKATDVYLGDSEWASTNNYDGLMDEVGFWDRVLTPSEILNNIYNGGTGNTWTGFFDNPPTITLNSPSSANYTTLQNITINLTTYDDFNLTDVKLYVNDALNQTNASGINNSNYLFNLNLGDGDYTIYGKATDNESQETNSSSIRIVINTTPFIEFVSPTLANGTNLSVNYIPVNVSLTETYFKNVTFYFYKGGVLNETITFTNSTRFYNKTACTCDTWEINATVWTTTGQSNSTETRTYFIDVAPPLVTNLLPNSTQDYILKGNSQNVTWNVEDINLDSCWVNHNGTNITVNCSSNLTQIIIQNHSANTLIFYANDTFGNLADDIISWDYTLFEYNQTFNNQTIEGAGENFAAIVAVKDGETITQAIFHYNSTNYTTNIIFSGGKYQITSSITISLIDVDTNFSLGYYIVIGGQIYNLQTSTQEVLNINMSECGVGGNLLINMSLKDEETKESILGDIEVNAQAISKTSNEIAESINLSLENISSGAICLTPAAAFANLYLDMEIKYSSTDHVQELYHIQKADMSDYPRNLSLFDLSINDSTEFLVKYQDDNLISVEGAVLQLQRKYISEDLYEIVEAPLTSNSGTAIVHIDLNANKYKIIVVKDGEVLDIFDNIVFNCENELSGQCTELLLGKIDSQNDVPLIELTDFAYSITSTNNTITTIFTIPSGTPAEINILLTQTDQFGNESVCNQTIISSGGSIDCTFDDTIGDSFLQLVISKDQSLQAQQSYIVTEDSGLDFLGNNFFIVIIFMLSVVGMAFSSPEWMILNAVVVMLIGGALWLLNGVDFVMGLGSLIWLIVSAGIIIFKLSKQEDR